MVARSEAHDSGLCRADRETRRAFAADLLNLTLAAPPLNRYVKKAKDAAELDAGAEPLLVCTPGGQGEAQIRADGGLARDTSPGRGAGRLRRWID